MKKLDRKGMDFVVSALAVSCIVMAALLSTRLFARLDLTAARMYTISDASKKTMRGIPEEVRITYYVSAKLEQIHPAPGMVKDLLGEYAAHSNGKVKVDFVDPDAGAGTAPGMAAEEAKRLGVQPRTVQTDDRGEVRLISVYSGIVIHYLDRFETLPFVLATESIEYDLTRLVKKLVSDRARVAGVLLGDKDKALDRDYQQFSKALQSAGFEVRPVKGGEDIGTDITCLFVLGNSGLDDFDLYPVDRYVARGGPVMFAVKGVDISTQYGLKAAPVSNGSLLAMLDSYGVAVGRELVLDKSCASIPFMVGESMASLEPYPHWVTILQKYASSTHPVTSRFSGLDLYWPSPLTVTAKEGIKSEIMVSSTTQAWKMKDNLTVSPEENVLFGLEAEKTKGQYPLAVSLVGTFKSFYEGKPQPRREGVSASFSTGRLEPKEARVIVVGSADFLTDIKEIIYYQTFGRYDPNPNFEFLAASADWLGSDEEIIGIRAKAARDVRLNVIQDKPEFQARVVWTYIVTLGIVPFLVIAAGTLRMLKRKKMRTQEYGAEGTK